MQSTSGINNRNDDTGDDETDSIGTSRASLDDASPGGTGDDESSRGTSASGSEADNREDDDAADGTDDSSDDTSHGVESRSADSGQGSYGGFKNEGPASSDGEPLDDEGRNDVGRARGADLGGQAASSSKSGGSLPDGARDSDAG